MLMFVRNFSMYSCGIDGDTFESINLWVGLINGLTVRTLVVCTLLIVIILWLATKFCAFSLSVEINADTKARDSGSEMDSFGASDFRDSMYVVFHCCQ